MNTFELVQARLGLGEIPPEMLLEMNSGMDVQHDPSKRSTLRTLGCAGLGLVAGGGIAAGIGDYISGQRNWTSTETIVGFVDDRVEEARSVILYLGGLGAQTSYPKAKLLSEGLFGPDEPQDPAVAYVEYPEDELDMDEISDEISGFLTSRDVKEITIVAESWAGIMGLSVISRLDESIRARSLLEDCAIVRGSDLLRAGDRHLVKFLARFKGYDAGKVSSYIGAFLSHDDGEMNFPLDVADRAEAAQNRVSGHINDGGGSPKTWLWKVAQIDRSDPEVWREKTEYRIRENGTKVVYLRPNPTQNDPRVNVEEAPESVYIATGQTPENRPIDDGFHTMNPKTLGKYQTEVRRQFRTAA